MATAVIRDVKPINAKFIDVRGRSQKITYSTNRSKITEVLPFRVKFINIGIDAYGPNNPAPIGIAVVGYNNYVL